MMIADVDIYRTFVLTPAIRSQSGWEHKEGELSFLSPDPNESHYCAPDLYRPGINMSHCARVRTNDPHQMAARANVVVCSPIAQVSLTDRSSHGG